MLMETNAYQPGQPPFVSPILWSRPPPVLDTSRQDEVTERVSS